MYKSKLLTALLAAGFAGSVYAAQPAFDEVDQNGDGNVSREEASAIEGMDFDTADTNRDGVLSQEEYDAASAQ